MSFGIFGICHVNTLIENTLYPYFCIEQRRVKIGEWKSVQYNRKLLVTGVPYKRTLLYIEDTVNVVFC